MCNLFTDGIIYIGLADAEHFHCLRGIKSSTTMFIDSVQYPAQTMLCVLA